MEKKILIADDEVDFAQVLASTLTEAGYAVELVPNGKVALEKISSDEFELLITDLNMPEMDGIELLKQVKNANPDLKVICMSGYVDFVDKVRALQMGTKAILQKPFKPEDLLEAVESALRKVQFADESDPSKYAALTIGEFISPSELKFPLFIKLPDGRFIQIAQVGDIVPRDKLLDLRTKNINEIWLLLEDFAKYKEEQILIAKAISGKGAKNISQSLKVKILKAAGELASEEMRVMGVSSDLAASSIELMTESMATILSLNDPKSTLLNVLENSNNSLYSHASTCSIIAGICAKIYGWSSKKNINSLVQAAFLHDIGMYDLPPELQNKKFLELSEKDRAVYVTHPKLGYDKLKDIPGVSDEVLKAVLQHHERLDGSGYPGGLRKSDINPMARLISFIDRYVEEWQTLPLEKKKNPKAPQLLINSIVTKAPLLYDRIDVIAVQLAITEADLAQARIAFQSASRT